MIAPSKLRTPESRALPISAVDSVLMSLSPDRPRSESWKELPGGLPGGLQIFHQIWGGGFVQAAKGPRRQITPAAAGESAQAAQGVFALAIKLQEPRLREPADPAPRARSRASRRNHREG